MKLRQKAKVKNKTKYKTRTRENTGQVQDKIQNKAKQVTQNKTVFTEYTLAFLQAVWRSGKQTRAYSMTTQIIT